MLWYLLVIMPDHNDNFPAQVKSVRSTSPHDHFNIVHFCCDYWPVQQLLLHFPSGLQVYQTVPLAHQEPALYHSPWWCWFGGRWSVLLNLWTCREWLLAVASSKMMILLFWTRARANHTNYLSPTLKFDPPSLNWYFSCCGSSYTRTFSCISSRAVQVSWSVYCENGSTFLLRVPPKSTGSCVITAMNRRAFWRLIDVDNN